MAVDRASLQPGPMGWGVGVAKPLAQDLSMLEANQEASPAFYTGRPGQPYQEAYVKRVFESLAEFYPGLSAGFTQWALGRYGSALDLNMQRLPAQVIGSCVASGGGRVFGYRTLTQILIYGKFELLMGRDLTGDNSVASYMPYNYGWGRKIAGLRGGDGSFCAPHIESFRLHGALDCNTAGLTGRKPEPSSASEYRSWGNWNHIEDYEEEGKKIRLMESERIEDAERLWEVVVEQHKPCMICSSWGFQPLRFLPQFNLWEYRHSGSWAHNMSISGGLDFNGDRFIDVGNTWGYNAHKPVPGLSDPGEDYGPNFYTSLDTADAWLKQAVCMTIGDIDLLDSEDPQW